MKKPMILILTILLVCLIAACAAPSTDDQTNLPQDNIADNDMDIPTNGTPAVLAAPFEEHVGDKAYFFPTSDDFLVLMYDASNTDISGEKGITTYELISFEDGEVADVMHKWLFGDAAEASAYAEGKDNFVAYENVVYEIDPVNAFMDPTKASVIDWAEGKEAELYISQPL